MAKSITQTSKIQPCNSFVTAQAVTNEMIFQTVDIGAGDVYNMRGRIISSKAHVFRAALFPYIENSGILSQTGGRRNPLRGIRATEGAVV
jgi:hypothetical protein